MRGERSPPTVWQCITCNLSITKVNTSQTSNPLLSQPIRESIDGRGRRNVERSKGTITAVGKAATSRNSWKEARAPVSAVWLYVFGK